MVSDGTPPISQRLAIRPCPEPHHSSSPPSSLYPTHTLSLLEIAFPNYLFWDVRKCDLFIKLHQQKFQRLLTAKI
jgi:hypothetical protein